MKRIICLIISIVMMFSCVNVFAEEAGDERVEIAFKVGDSVLKINGVDVEVVTPFIAGEGTTLVPLRVITEAFGAQVEWIAETRSIRLTYREVEVLLQIDNITAQVNDHTETLQVAPMLVNNTTMVPLRFISETFGATVGWNEADKSITVVKEKLQLGETVKGGVAEKYVGDSYFKWSMDTPADFILSERSYDGSNTVFTNSDGQDVLYVNVIPNLDGDSLERLQMDADELFEGGTLSYATYAFNKDGERYTYSYGSVGGKYQYIAQYIKEGIIYRVIVLTEQDSKNKEYLEGVANSFRLEYNPSNPTYDLSNVNEDGTRQFTDEKYAITFTVPAYFLKVFGENDNEIVLASGKGDKSFIGINIYSKTEDFTSESYLTAEMSESKAILNKSIAGVGKTAEYKVNEIDSKGYDITIKKSYKSDCVWNKRFFEVGDYVYLIEIACTKENKDNFAQALFDSITVSPLDKEEIGYLVRQGKAEGSTEHNVGGFFITAPNNWSRYEDADGFYMQESQTDSAIHFSYQYVSGYTQLSGEANFLMMSHLKSQLADNISNIAYERNGYVEESIELTKWKGRDCYTSVIRIDEDGRRIYLSFAIIFERGYLYIGQMAQDELHYNSDIYKEFLDITASIK